MFFCKNVEEERQEGGLECEGENLLEVEELICSHLEQGFPF